LTACAVVRWLEVCGFFFFFIAASRTRPWYCHIYQLMLRYYCTRDYV
jgi:hypothetical protein